MEKINPSVNSFMIGSALGDGAFVKKTENHNTYVVFKHSEKQIGYLMWKYNFLKENGLLRDTKEVKEHKLFGCYKTNNRQFEFSTKTFKELNQYKAASYDELLNRLDEFALAIWVLDDGNVCRRVTKIACGSKPKEWCMKVVEILNNDFGLSSLYYEHPTNHIKNYITIRARSFERLKEIVLKYVPSDLDVVKSKFGDKEN